MTFLRIYFPFAAGYLLSYLFRTVNAVISPELVRDLTLDPSSLGLLTSAYFLAFGAAQIPVGMLLDRFGPRRVEPVLLCIAATGALLFASADSLPALAFARAVIGTRRVRVPDGAAEGDCRVVPAGATGDRWPAGSWWPAAWARWPRPRRWSLRCASRAGAASSWHSR